MISTTSVADRTFYEIFLKLSGVDFTELRRTVSSQSAAMDSARYLQSFSYFDGYVASLSSFGYPQQQNVAGEHTVSSVPILGTQFNLPPSCHQYNSPSCDLNSRLSYPHNQTFQGPQVQDWQRDIITTTPNFLPHLQVPSPCHESAQHQQYSTYTPSSSYSHYDNCRYYYNNDNTVPDSQVTPVSTMQCCARRGCSIYCLHDQQSALMSLSALANSVHLAHHAASSAAAAAGSASFVDMSPSALYDSQSGRSATQQLTPNVQTVLRRCSDGMTTSSTESSPENPPSQFVPTLQVVRPKIEPVELSLKPRGRRTGPLPAAAVRLLRAWYDDHRDHPYIDGVEAAQLASQCHLSVAQLRKWLANRRLRTNSTKHIAEVVNRRRLKTAARRRCNQFDRCSLHEDQSQQL